VARGNSSVVAWGNSSVVARGNSSVEAWDNSSVRSFSVAVKVFLHGFTVLFLHTKCKFEKKSKHAMVQKIKDLGFFENNGAKKTANVILYKRVSKDFKTQEGTPNETVWTIGSTLTHPNWSPKTDECGEGKFHAVSRPYFADEFRHESGDKYIAIEIKSKDLHEWKNPRYPHKIAFREGKVLFECDRLGKEVK
jgi:hypothetical protein